MSAISGIMASDAQKEASAQAAQAQLEGTKYSTDAMMEMFNLTASSFFPPPIIVC